MGLSYISNLEQGALRAHAPPKIYAGGQCSCKILQQQMRDPGIHGHPINEEITWYSPHQPATELRMSKCLTLSRFRQWQYWRSEWGWKKRESWKRGWYPDPIDTWNYQVLYELVLQRCSHQSSSKFWFKNGPEAISEHLILTNFLWRWRPSVKHCSLMPACKACFSLHPLFSAYPLLGTYLLVIATSNHLLQVYKYECI